MTNALYDIVFQGKIQPEFELEQVKEHLGRLFGASPEMLVKMFSGQAIVIKKSADRATVEKYLHAMEKAGAIVHVYANDGSVVDFAKTSPQLQTAPPTPVATTAILESSADLDAITLAALGEQIIPTAPFVPAKFNTEALSIAPPGVDVIERTPAPPPFQANLDDLTMANPGERILDPNAPIVQNRGAVFSYKKP